MHMALAVDSHRPGWAVPRERGSHRCPGSGGLPAEAGLRLQLWGDSPPRGGGFTPELQGVVWGPLESQPSPLASQGFPQASHPAEPSNPVSPQYR